MEYMILLNSDENFEAPEPGSPAFDAMMAEWFTYNQRLIDGGHWIAGASLQPTTTATTIRKTFGGAPLVSDGPTPRPRSSSAGST